MMKAIEIKVQKESPKTILDRYTTSFDVASGVTSLDIKTLIKPSMRYPNEVSSEIVYNKNKETKDADVIDLDSKIEYVLTLK